MIDIGEKINLANGNVTVKVKLECLNIVFQWNLIFRIWPQKHDYLSNQISGRTETKYYRRVNNFPNRIWQIYNIFFYLKAYYLTFRDITFLSYLDFRMQEFSKLVAHRIVIFDTKFHKKLMSNCIVFVFWNIVSFLRW